LKTVSYIIILLGILTLSACDKKTPPKEAPPPPTSKEKTSNDLEVTASAYTSRAGETDSTPSLAAWGDTLKPHMKAIAVSQDLIKMGLSHGVKVSIDGLTGTYTVLDKMNKKWTKKIDIYMGLDTKKAKEWGKQKVTIHWDK
jgi:3D (Asp-Asp-Asp) domain-containing protein